MTGHETDSPTDRESRAKRPFCYREPDTRTLDISLACRRSTEPPDSQPTSVARAGQLMRDAARGPIPHRPPVTVRQRVGEYAIVEGNATLSVAVRHRWRTLPVLVETGEGS